MVIFNDPGVLLMIVGAITTPLCWANIVAGAEGVAEAVQEVEVAAVSPTADVKIDIQ